jgi:thioester reductase-like protein
MEKRIFLTGATGFLGSHLAWKLLEQGKPLRCLVRAGNRPAEERLAELFLKITNREGDVREALKRIEFIHGDVAVPDFGLARTEYRRLLYSSEIWHCAASLSLSGEDKEEIFRTNLNGSHNALKLAELIETRRLHYLSTAYISGNRMGRVMENEIFLGQEFKNPYEESKCMAELLVKELESNNRLECTIYRPSIVVGNSRDGRVTHFHGVYSFIRGIIAALQRLPFGNKLDELVEIPFRIVGMATKTLNMVPVDYVIDAIHSISLREESVGKTFHVVNPKPTMNRVWLETFCKTIGITGLKFVTSHEFQNSPMNVWEKLFSRKMAFYAMYLSGEPIFDDSNTQHLLSTTGIKCPRLDQRLMQAMIRGYLQLAEPSMLRAQA